MYRYLWSNGPKECLEFADYTFDEHFGKPIPSFPPREVLADYITGRAEASGVRPQVQFQTAVRWVAFDEANDRFEVTVESLSDKSTRVEHFDYVIVATGHFSVPNMPDYEGFSRFPGRVLALPRLPGRQRVRRQGPAGHGQQLLRRGRRPADEEVRREVGHDQLPQPADGLRLARRASRRCRACSGWTGRPRTSPTAPAVRSMRSCCARDISTTSPSSRRACG
ncbi:MAG: hypothetical protein WKF47_04165 [Geodermatophilaceae bacterium]